MEKLLTTRQVADILQVAKLDTVYRYIASGKLKARKLGGYCKKRHWRIKLEDLEAFVNGNNRQAGAGSQHTEPSLRNKRQE